MCSLFQLQRENFKGYISRNKISFSLTQAKYNIRYSESIHIRGIKTKNNPNWNKKNCRKCKCYADNILRTQNAKISSITFQFSVFKQYVNSTQQNGFSNNSACMYQTNACRWPGRVGWGGMLTYGALRGYFPCQLCQREILEEMMLTSPVWFFILRNPCSEKLTVHIHYLWNY